MLGEQEPQAMLAMHRRYGEALIIGEGEDEVRVEVTRTTHSWADLLITAPSRIPIDREEIRREKLGHGSLDRPGGDGYSRMKIKVAPGKCVIIGSGPDEVRLHVVAIKLPRARLGIDAPRWISVDREELRIRKLQHMTTVS